MKNKIKIVFGLPSLAVGGIERQVIKQLQYFDREKFDLNLITLFDYSNIPNLYDKVPGDVSVYKIGFKGKFDLGGFSRLRKVLKDIDPDLVVTSMFSANTVFRLLSSDFKYVCIPREHNIYHEKKFWQIWLDKILAKKSYKIISVSKTVAEFASKQAGIPIEKFKVIHNGVEIEKIKEFRKENNYEKENILLNVGRLKKQKNQKLLIDSFIKVKDELKDWRLVIVGRGSEEQNLKNYIKEKDIEDQVILAGYSENVYEYYSKAKAFILTSKHEGFPNVSVEAMAFGLPLISTLVPGVDEFLKDGENGLLVDDNVESISEAMVKISGLNEVEYGQIRDKSERTAEMFDIKENVRKYEELFIEASLRRD